MQTTRTCIALALVLCASLLPAPAVGKGATTSSLEQATAEWKSASRAGSRATRAKWTKVVAGLEGAASGPQKALALLRAGRAAEELSRHSGSSADAKRAVRLYVSAAEAGGSLADDALVDAARLEATRLANVEAARALLTRAVALGGDQRALATSTLRGLPSSPTPATSSPPLPTRIASAEPARDVSVLEEATRQWKALRADRTRRKSRQHWETAITRLEKAGDCLAPSGSGAVAYMRAGTAAEELSRLSKRRKDAERAISLYLQVAEKCPKTSLVDDALVAAAGLEANRLGDLAAARRHLAAAIAQDGDLAARARRQAAVLRRDEEPAHAATPAADVPPSAVAAKAAAPAGPEIDGDDLGALTAAADEAGTKAAAQQARRLKTATGAEMSLSEQIGLKVRRIVIDAGHGGHDTGAIGPTGVREKDVTLGMARRLAQLLSARGFETVLTRDDDTFLALEERTKVANRERGDLFISIHANAHKSPKQSGVETYSLNVASDRFAMRLAARENATTESSVSDLQLLLADLATRANTVDSTRLARLVQASILTGVAKEHGRPKDHGVKNALFYVLLGARMPAVLVETAFLSNPGEEKKLASDAYQQAVASAIADAVDQFVARRTQLAWVQ